jgi:hypothetical protein
MTATLEQQFRSTDLPAWPSLTGQAGSLIALLKAILVDGGTTASITSITRSGTTATATIASANTSLIPGANIYLTFAGANETDYNVTQAPCTVVDSTHVTYQVANSPTSPATGTITYRRAAMGWTEAFNGTNLSALRPASVSGYPQPYLRIDETGGTAGGQKEVAVRGYESMSDVNTGTGPVPTVAQAASGGCWRKSTTADSTARAWTIFANKFAFWFVPNSDASATLGRHLNGFGGFPSFTSGDAFNWFLAAQGAFNVTSSTVANGGACVEAPPAITGSSAGLWIARAFSQTGGAIASMRIQPMRHNSGGNGVAGGTAGGFLAYPNGPDGALWCSPALFTDSQSGNSYRGVLPGLYSHPHTTLPLGEYDTSTNVANLSGVTLTGVLIQCNSTQGLQLFDTYGPW